MATLSREAIERMGFGGVGNNVRISDKASFYGTARIVLGDNVRIDDFCVLSAGDGGIFLGNYIHIAVYSSIIGAGMVTLEDFVNISSRVGIYSSSDDYSGAAMTNPTIPSLYTNVQSADVRICRHSIIGCGAVILPGVTIADGVAIGALSLVNSNCKPFSIYAGVPVRRIKERKQDFLRLEQQFRYSMRDDQTC